jgi:hypothetical protein
MQKKPATKHEIIKLMAVVNKVCEHMKLRKDITLPEMGKIADVLEETNFIVEDMPAED